MTKITRMEIGSLLLVIGIVLLLAAGHADGTVDLTIYLLALVPGIAGAAIIYAEQRRER